VLFAQVLRSRVFEVRRQAAIDERTALRRQQVGSADRSERIRTYNFPQNRITDHRIGMSRWGGLRSGDGGGGVGGWCVCMCVCVRAYV
jgi:hypothetical protein